MYCMITVMKNTKNYHELRMKRKNENEKKKIIIVNILLGKIKKLLRLITAIVYGRKWALTV